MLKTIIPILLILSSNVNAVTDSQTTIKSKSKSRKKKKTTSIQIAQKYYTNINRLNAPSDEDKNKFGQFIELKGKQKFKPFKRTILVNLPSASLDFTPKMEKKIRGLNFSNTLIGLYISSRDLVFSSSFSLGYSDLMSTNDEAQLVNDNYYNIGTDFGVDYNLTKKLKTNFTLGASIQDYSRPSLENAIEENDKNEDDFYKVFVKAKPSYKINKVISIGLEQKYEKKLSREKRSLSQAGAATGNQVEVIDNYKTNLGLTIKTARFSLAPTIGHTFNNDMKNNGKSYKGPEYSLGTKLYYENITVNTKLSKKVRKYESQQIDTSKKLGTSPTRNLEIHKLSNNLEFYKLIADNGDLIIGHDFQKIKSNKESDNNNSHVFKFGIKFPL